MDINTQCKCGAILKAKQELAGKQAKCPKCGDAILIPKPDSIRLTCSCGQIIRAKSSLVGKRVKCPTCKQPVDIPNTTGMPSTDVLSPAKVNKSPTLGDAPIQLPATPESRFDDSVWDDLAKTAEKVENNKKAEMGQGKPTATRSAASWQRGSLDSVQLGITLNYIGVLLNVAAVLLSILLVMLSKAAPLLIFCGVLLIAASLLSMIGRILCLTVPKQVEATTWIYLAVAFDVMALLASVSRMIPGMPNLNSISGLLSILGTVLFVIFLRKLATHINSGDLVQRASELLILGGGLVLFYVASVVVMFISGLLGMIMLLIVAVMLLLACFRYFQLLSDLRLSLS